MVAEGQGRVHAFGESDEGGESFEKAAFLIRAARGFCRPFHGCRALLGALGPAARCAEDHPVLIELLRGSGQPGTLLPSFMSHSPSLRADLHRAWLRVFEAAELRGPIVIFDAPLLDADSLAVIHTLARTRGLSIVVELDVPRPGDLHGGRSFDLGHTALSSMAASLGRGQPWSAAHPETRPAAEHDCAPLDLDTERQLFAQLEAGAPVDARAWLETLRRSFAVGGFAAVLGLGDAVLGLGAHRQPVAESLSPAERAEAHTLIGLAAYARHVETQGSEAIGEFMAGHFEQALALEREPARVAALMQRMSMVAARRRHDTHAARSWAARAIEAAASAQDPAAGYARAWARNALAYVLAYDRRIDPARSEMDAALAELVAIPANSPALPRGELELAELAFLDNRIELALLAGDRAAARAGAEQLAARELELRGAVVLSHVRCLRLSATIAAHTPACLERARTAVTTLARADDPVSELACAGLLAVFAERLGRIDEACEALSRCLTLRRELATALACQRTQARLALLHWRAGRTTHALALLDALAEQAEGPLATECLAVRARLTAARDEAEAFANRAIDAATEFGDSRTVLRVALWLLELCERLDDREAAADLAAEVRRIAGTFGPSITAGERCWLATTLADPELLPAKLELDDALDELELWWRLDALAELLDRAGRTEAASVRALAALRTPPAGPPAGQGSG